MGRLRRLSWYERIKSDPSPEDPALLQIARELAVQLDSLVWYKQIVWGRFNRGGVGWIISKPVVSRESFLAYPGFPVVELMLPEFLKGKLSLDEWRVLIGMHFMRLKAYNSARMSGLMALLILVLLGAFGTLFLLLYILVGRGLASILIFPLLSPAIVLSLFFTRRYLRGWEFELDKKTADRFGIEQVLRLLEKTQALESEARSSTRNPYYRLLDLLSINIQDRIDSLGSSQLVPQPIPPPGPSKTFHVSLRTRAIILLVGLAVFSGSGAVGFRLFGNGQSNVVCAAVDCVALVFIGFVGEVVTILGAITTAVGLFGRVRKARRKKGQKLIE